MKDFITEDNKKEFDYVIFARQFDSYRWFKPILTIILFVIFYLIMDVILAAGAMVGDFMRTGGDLNGFLERFSDIGYDNINVYDATGAVVELGSIALMIPALFLARLVVRERSFSSYTSSRGGWNHTVFFKSFFIALLVCGVPLLVDAFVISDPGEINNQFTTPGFIIFLILLPLQCIAEEYVFRGLAAQTIGSWTRVPIAAIIISSVGFTALHPYNTIGRISIFVSGLCMGLAAWIGRGIEVSAAIHIVNNYIAFLLAGFGISEISSEVSVGSMIEDVCINVAYVAVIYLIYRKTDWFDRIKYYDAKEWNEGLAEKKARKLAIKNAKAAKKAAKKS